MLQPNVSEGNNNSEDRNIKLEYKREDIPKWLDRGFIQYSLKNSKSFHQCTVTNITVDYGCSPSQTFGNKLYRVNLTLRNQDAPEQSTSLIIKCAPDVTKEEYLSYGIKSFRNETVVLSNIMCKVNELLRSTGCSESISAEWICGGEEPKNFIMIEDLSLTSYQMAKRKEGLDLNHSLLVMRLIAKYHAATAVLIQRDTAAIEDFKVCKRFESGNDRGLRFLITVVQPHILGTLSEILNLSGDVIDRTRKLCETIVDKLEKLVQYKPQIFNVLGHGDVWVNNLMFKYFKEEVVSVKLLDFQESYISSPSHDLLFYLNSSLKEEVEMNYSELLIDEYYKTLNQTLNMLHYDGIPYSMQDLKNDMQEYKLLEIFASLIISALALASEDNSVRLEGTLKGHLDIFANIYSNPIYIRKLGRKLLTFVENGYM